jgi:hypothetical protein
MDERDELKKRIRAGNFVINTGRVMRAINVLRHEYHPLKGIQYALEVEMAEDEFLDAINFLHEAGYIHLRNIETKEMAVAGLADTDYRQLAAKLTDKGIRLTAPNSGLKDPLVKV